jgi:hypothetical protein
LHNDAGKFSERAAFGEVRAEEARSSPSVGHAVLIGVEIGRAGNLRLVDQIVVFVRRRGEEDRATVGLGLIDDAGVAFIATPGSISRRRQGLLICDRRIGRRRTRGGIIERRTFLHRRQD